MAMDERSNRTAADGERGNARPLTNAAAPKIEHEQARRPNTPASTYADRTNPGLTLSAEDHERLSALAQAVGNKLPELAAVLADEVGRARVLAGGELPKHSVFMNSEVEFRDDATGKVRKVTLVYPNDADISRGRISVLTPVGTALIGLPTGHSITWETPGGEMRQLTVLSVRGPHPF